MAATSVGAPTCHRLHRLLHRPPPPSSSFSLLFKPLLISTTTTTTTTTTISPSKHLHIPHRTLLSSSLPYLPSRPLLFCYSPTLSFSATEAPLQEQEETQELQIQEDDGNDGDVGEETEIEIENLNGKEDAQVGLESSLILKRDGVELPNLTVKEKKELASYAHSLGKKLKSQLVGKSGVTPSVAASFIENLESNELLKVKIHGTCPGELDDAVAQLAEATGSVVVGQIGRTVILYRPSLTKLKAEEKKLQARKVYMRKKQTLKPRLLMELQKKGERPRTYGRDRRGRSRV